MRGEISPSLLTPSSKRFFAFFIDGYGAAGNILGGKLLGAKDYTNLWKLAKKVLLYGILVSLVLVILGFIFYYPIGRLFSNEQIVLDTFYSVFYILILGLPMNALAFVYDGLFKGLGEISPDEFKNFIGEDIRLDPVEVRKEDHLSQMLQYFMGKNTPERQDFIIENLRVEKDLVEEEVD